LMRMQTDMQSPTEKPVGMGIVVRLLLLCGNWEEAKHCEMLRV
jgi:hypothetical protein